MANEALVLSAANLDIIENHLSHLTNNLGKVSLDMSQVDQKVNDVTASVSAIEDEIKAFMVEIKGSTIVSNARQTILLAQGEIEKKYGHYDQVRRQINGILQASDMSALSKDNLKNISEETLINTPNYWLAPALIALSSWLLNDKDKAQSSLKEAMRRDDEKTSLLFSLIHARAGRYETSHRWLKRYLTMQDSANMSHVVFVVLDAISTGAFGPKSKETIKTYIEKWLSEINTKQIKDHEIKRLRYFISDFRKEEDEDFFCIENYTNEYENVKKSIATTKSKSGIFQYLHMLNNEKMISDNKMKKIDRLLEMLVFSYEDQELELRREIAKSKFVIEENGNIGKANERFKQSELAFTNNNNFYSLLVSISLGLYNVSPNLKKMALALTKELFIEAYREELKDNDLAQENYIEVKLSDWSFKIKDGSEEKELVKELEEQHEYKLNQELRKVPLYDLKMISTIIIGIIAIFFTIKIPALAIAILVAVAAFNIYNLALSISTRSKIETQAKKELESSLELLENIIAEVVDYRMIGRSSRKTDEEIINHLNNLNYLDYVSVDGHRNIIIGGLNG